jgi:hypothetical protein
MKGSMKENCSPAGRTVVLAPVPLLYCAPLLNGFSLFRFLYPLWTLRVIHKCYFIKEQVSDLRFKHKHILNVVTMVLSVTVSLAEHQLFVFVVLNSGSCACYKHLFPQLLLLYILMLPSYFPVLYIMGDAGKLALSC